MDGANWFWGEEIFQKYWGDLVLCDRFLKN